MEFQHSTQIWACFPQLVPAVAAVTGIPTDVDIDAPVQRFAARAAERLTGQSEAELPEIQAWRRAFAAMGLKPTQYRCAAEALLRRFRKEGALPRIHPLVDLCNAVSIAYAAPVAVFDLDRIEGYLAVRHADGTERYTTFAGDVENPAAGEVVFADAAGQAHARRWSNRQSGLSAVGPATRSALIVSEALHNSAGTDQQRLLADLTTVLADADIRSTAAAVLTAEAPRFAFEM